MLEKKSSAKFNNRLWFNIVAGLIDLIIFFLGVYIIFLSKKIFINNFYHNIKIFNFNFTILRLISFILSVISFIIHIYGFREANNNGVYNVGNVLGIAASGLVILKLGNLKLFPIMVYFIAGIFSFIQKKSYL